MDAQKHTTAAVEVNVYVNEDGSVELYFVFCPNTGASLLLGEYESLDEAKELVNFTKEPDLDKQAFEDFIDLAHPEAEIIATETETGTIYSVVE